MPQCRLKKQDFTATKKALTLSVQGLAHKEGRTTEEVWEDIDEKPEAMLPVLLTSGRMKEYIPEFMQQVHAQQVCSPFFQHLHCGNVLNKYCPVPHTVLFPN